MIAFHDNKIVFRKCSAPELCFFVFCLNNHHEKGVRKLPIISLLSILYYLNSKNVSKFIQLNR